MRCSDSDVIASKLIKLINIVPSYKNKYSKEMAIFKIKNELSERQFNILYSLATFNKNTISELSELMNVSKSTLSIVMSKMLKKGFIIKTYPNDYEDKRKIYFSLSDKGINKLKELRQIYIDDFRNMYNSFNEQQKADFKKGISMLNTIVIYKNKNIINEIIHSNDEIEKIGSKIALFFSNFIEVSKDLCKGEFNINGNNNSLTKNQFFILIAINTYKYDTVSKLEKFLHSSGSTVSITISKLVKNGYLYKVYPSGDEDGRIIYIKLTEKGENILKTTQERVKFLFKKFIESLEEEQRCTLEDAMDLLLSVFIIKMYT